MFLKFSIKVYPNVQVKIRVRRKRAENMTEENCESRCWTVWVFVENNREAKTCSGTCQTPCSRNGSVLSMPWVWICTTRNCSRCRYVVLRVEPSITRNNGFSSFICICWYREGRDSACGSVHWQSCCRARDTTESCRGPWIVRAQLASTCATCHPRREISIPDRTSRGSTSTNGRPGVFGHPPIAQP